jgi:flagellar basal-body rod modification protein FlgD
MSTTPISTDANGNQAVGTAGTTLTNSSSTQLSSNEFLDLMMTELTHQDPTNPDSSDPTQYLSQLAQLTSVEQETDTAKSTAESATEAAVSQSVGLIGDSVTYVDQTTGADVTGTVKSVQITSSGPTLTIDGVSGIDPAYVIGVQPAGSSGTSSTSDSQSGADGAAGSATATPSASSLLGTGGTTDTSSASGSSGTGGASGAGSSSTADPFVF